MMGEYGSKIYQINFGFFGIFAFVYPPVLLYAGYTLYKNSNLTLRRLEFTLTTLLLFLSLLILQYLIADIGDIGHAIIETSKSYIGTLGIWLLALLGLSLSILSYSNQDISVLFAKLKQKLSPHLQSALNSLSQGLKELLSTLTYTLKTLKPKKEQNFDSPKNLPTFIDVPNLENLKEDTPPQTPIIQTPPKEEKKEEEESPQPEPSIPVRNFNTGYRNNIEEIKVQEFIITQQPTQHPQVKIIASQEPQEEVKAPLWDIDLSEHKTSSVSTSTEILRQIRQDTKKKLPQTPKSTKKTKPQIFSKEIIIEEEPLRTQDPAPSLEETPLTPPQPPLQITQESQSTLAPSRSEQTPTYYPTQERPGPSLKSNVQKSHIHIKTLAENEALLQELDRGEVEIPKNYELPPLDLLTQPPKNPENTIDESEIDSKIQKLMEKLSVFKIDGDVIRTYSGPIITTLEYRPAPNVKVSRIQSLENDLAMALEARSIRIQAPIPGKNVVGIEIPNSQTQTIYLREILQSELFQSSSSPLTLALGKDVVGNPFITDLKKLPHLLIAGTTGSGKSVGINAMILSLLYRNSPEDLKLMMVDPKMVEFMPYSDLPHLITPIITDPKKAVIGLASAVLEMERRYKLMSESLTKEIVSYNQKAEQEGLEKFPYFIIIIDELADLMMTAGKEVESSIARIAQMGRASGMHLIVATQSPRADVIMGGIKTNLPARLSYKVGSKIDAGIIGCTGAETLLGRGDSLFTPPGLSGLIRLHAPWSSEEEVNEIVNYIKSQRQPQYDVSFIPEEKESFGALDPQELDPETTQLLNQAKTIILQENKTSVSYLQRRLSIGYNKAANLIETLERTGFLSKANSKGERQIFGE